MAPAAAAAASNILAAATATSAKRPAASEPEDQLLVADSSSSALTPPQLQIDDDGEAARSSKNNNSNHQKQQLQQLECPRCRSTNTKFCYYNNYSTSQPRHFCRACRRYWTHGGTLRDVPVGGATRRSNKRQRRAAADPSSSSSASSPPPHTTTTTLTQDACPPPPDLLSTATAQAFPFLSDGRYYLPNAQHLDLGLLAAPPAFSWQQPSVVPDFYAPWDDGTAANSSGAAWGDIAAGLDLITWPPPAN